MNKIIKYIGASAVVCMMAGCTTNFEDFNTNPYQPSKVPAMTVHGEDSTAISILLSFWSRTLRKRKVSFMPWLS